MAWNDIITRKLKETFVWEKAVITAECKCANTMVCYGSVFANSCVTVADV